MIVITFKKMYFVHSRVDRLQSLVHGTVLILGDSLVVELSSLARVALVRIQVPQPKNCYFL